jgi:ParB family chromosome partitioning protein
MNIKSINIDNLEISPLNVRKIKCDESLTNLKNDIEQHGLLNPLTVIFNDKTNKHEIIAGQRRFTVLKELNYKLIQCNIIDSDKSENDQIILSLSENIHRSPMLLSERVKTYKKLIDKIKDIEQVAKCIGISKDTLKQYDKISHFPDFIIDKLDAKGNEKMSLEFAINLSKLDFLSIQISNLNKEDINVEEKKKIEDDLKNLLDLFNDVSKDGQNNYRIIWSDEKVSDVLLGNSFLTPY